MEEKDKSCFIVAPSPQPSAYVTSCNYRDRMPARMYFFFPIIMAVFTLSPKDHAGLLFMLESRCICIDNSLHHSFHVSLRVQLHRTYCKITSCC